MARQVLNEGAELGIEGLPAIQQYRNFSLLRLWDRINPANALAAYQYQLSMLREVALRGTEQEFLWATRLAPLLIGRLAGI